MRQRRHRVRRVKRASSVPYTYMPSVMEITKIKIAGSSVTNDASAGPGQKPANPQPTPNMAEPASKRPSISTRVGRP